MYFNMCMFRSGHCSCEWHRPAACDAYALSCCNIVLQVLAGTGWWDRVPSWLASAHAAIAANVTTYASNAAAGSVQQQLAAETGVADSQLDELIGVQLRRRHPLLVPLPTYTGQRQQQQQQQEERQRQQRDGQQPLQQQLQGGYDGRTSAAAQMVSKTFAAVLQQVPVTYAMTVKPCAWSGML
jgi:hypothetical protein